VKKAASPSRARSTAIVLGLVTSSVFCLCVGALLAVRFEGLLRILLASSGFGAYLFFMGHALREMNLPRVLIEVRPDPEKRRLDAPPPAIVSGRSFENAQQTRQFRRRHAA
jgi:hypothetical protein